MFESTTHFGDYVNFLKIPDIYKTYLHKSMILTHLKGAIILRILYNIVRTTECNKVATARLLL